MSHAPSRIDDRGPVAVIAPVYRNAATLPELARRVDAALAGRAWRLHLVVDACPDDSAAAARALALADSRVQVTVLPVNVGQHRAIATGLDAADDAGAWVVLDADLQDPPEAIPALLDELATPCTACVGGHAVYAGRRGGYQGRGRLLTGRMHRTVAAALTGLPRDAGAFFAVDRSARDLVVRRVLTDRAPSAVTAAMGVCRAVSVPVVRQPRPVGGSAWSSRARAGQSLRTLRWSFAVAARSRTGLVHQLLGFLLIGGTATVGYLALYEVLRVVLAAESANVLARIVFAVVTTWVNARVVFRSRAGVGRLLAVSTASFLVGVVLTDIPLAVEQRLLGADHRVAEAVVLLIATAIATLARFAVLRLALLPPGPPLPRPSGPALHERKTAP